MAQKKIEKEEQSEPNLLEPTHPLFQRFKEACPGTVKHSLAVVQMVAEVAQVLDLDVEEMKLAATYHDIGKIVNPNIFSENQGEGNPHDEMDPWISSQMITRHVSDGVQLLINEQEFPRKVIEIISQHHGNTIVIYFFNKSKNKDKDRFRYFGPIPSSLEAAVLMICDSVEATAQSHIFNGKKTSPEKLVDQTIDRLVEDEQLNFMRIGDLKKIKEILRKELESILPKRVDYDSVDEEKKSDRKQGVY